MGRQGCCPRPDGPGWTSTVCPVSSTPSSVIVTVRRTTAPPPRRRRPTPSRRRVTPLSPVTSPTTVPPLSWVRVSGPRLHSRLSSQSPPTNRTLDSSCLPTPSLFLVPHPNEKTSTLFPSDLSSRSRRREGRPSRKRCVSVDSVRRLPPRSDPGSSSLFSAPDGWGPRPLGEPTRHPPVPPFPLWMSSIKPCYRCGRSLSPLFRTVHHSSFVPPTWDEF